MTLRLAIQLIASVVYFLGCRTEGAEFSYYERFASLIDTNGLGPPLANRTVSLNELMQSGEIAGVRVGTKMSAAVELWGKPRAFHASVDGCSMLTFSHGLLKFQDDHIVQIRISPHTVPGLSFENGLTATNPPEQFAKTLGLPVTGPTQWHLVVESKTSVMRLRWNHFAGGCQLSSLSLEAPQSSTGWPQLRTLDGSRTNLVGAWVLSDNWTGLMGVAIKFRDDGSFLYWAYSDVVTGDEPTYPITGTWRWEGGVLGLASAYILHATRWHPYEYHGEMCLLPDYARVWQQEDGKPHEDRLLFKIADFNEAHPFARRRK